MKSTGSAPKKAHLRGLLSCCRPLGPRLSGGHEAERLDSVSVGDLNGGAGVHVSLGNAPALSLKKAGDTAGAGSFALTMTAPKDDKDCVLTGKTATVRFLSMNGAAGPNGEWLALEGAGSAGVAKNVAVQIRDAKGVDVQLGRASSEYADLTQPMRFTANYIATGEATPGTANAKASFSADYK
ncbi:fimbrial protein [Pseudomonas protegens]|nr:fimbrial protein [Pseudomonas protegens]